MPVIRITIATEPQAKGRPRVTLKNGFFRTYTPERTKTAEDLIRYKIMKHKDKAFPAHVPVKLTCTFFRTKSKYLPKYETLPYRKPDLPNFLALLCDAMTKILYDDDAQITQVLMKKRWSPNGNGFITIKLEEDTLKEQ